MTKICPSEEMIADYVEGRLSGSDRSETEAHLSDCETCLEGFLVVKSLLRDSDGVQLNPAPNHVTQAAVRLVQSQISLSNRPSVERLRVSIRRLYARVLDLLRPLLWGRMAFAPIRGSKIVVSNGLVHLRKIFREIETEIEVEKTTKGKAHIRVRLSEASKYKKGVRVSLKKGERVISSYLIDREYVLFEDIPFEHYAFDFSKDGVKLGTYFFEIKESHHGRK
ncbi:MAG: zf-HC2 domain-containing protein [Deltaproteobacteria bacterium]|nr:zf-HC2 domain-containing protein [Deltaproteobacteria bacterium]